MPLLKDAAAGPARKTSTFAIPKLNTVVARKTSYAFEVGSRAVNSVSFVVSVFRCLG